MNITLQNIDKVNAEMTAVIEPADYEEKVKKAIKEYCKKVRMPGFRPGMVPQALVKKQFGTGILAEEVNKLLQDGLYNYIRENKVNMLGEPISSDENEKLELVDGNTFTFKFDIALAPEIDIKLTKHNKIEYYNVKIDDELINRQLDMYRQRGGKYEQVEDYQLGDMVKGTFTQLDEAGNAVEGGLVTADAVMLPGYMKDDDQKKLFDGAKKGSVIRCNPSVAYKDSETELTSLLKVNKEELANYKCDFNYEITEITRYVLGPVNEELFENTYPGQGIKTEDEFKARIADDLKAQYQKDSDFRFLMDARKYITEKVGKLEYPEEKLRKIMLSNAKGDEKKVEENFDKSLEELTWHLIKEKLVEQYEIKIDDNDVKEMAKDVTRMQFAQYGMLNVPEGYLESSVAEMLKKRETVDNLIDRAIDMKLGAKLKEVVALNAKEVSIDEFNKLFD